MTKKEYTILFVVAGVLAIAGVYAISHYFPHHPVLIDDASLAPSSAEPAPQVPYAPLPSEPANGFQGKG